MVEGRRLEDLVWGDGGRIVRRQPGWYDQRDAENKEAQGAGKRSWAQPARRGDGPPLPGPIWTEVRLNEGHGLVLRVVDPRVDEAVRQIGDEIAKGVRQREDENGPLHGRKIFLQDGKDQHA